MQHTIGQPTGIAAVYDLRKYRKNTPYKKETFFRMSLFLMPRRLNAPSVDKKHLTMLWFS